MNVIVYPLCATPCKELVGINKPAKRIYRTQDSEAVHQYGGKL
jgi:hypothetical protein